MVFFCLYSSLPASPFRKPIHHRLLPSGLPGCYQGKSPALGLKRIKSEVLFCYQQAELNSLGPHEQLYTGLRPQAHQFFSFLGCFMECIQVVTPYLTRKWRLRFSQRSLWDLNPGSRTQCCCLQVDLTSPRVCLLNENVDHSASFPHFLAALIVCKMLCLSSFKSHFKGLPWWLRW